ncbi:hypothetical protein GCM10027605_64000 [Micromonospora zhanjiangensis]
MDDLTIRDREPADLRRCLPVLGDVHRLDGYPLNWPADPLRWLAPENALHGWVAETGDNTVVGHVAVHRVVSPGAVPATGAEVSRLFVAPTARRYNLATRLLHKAREWAAEHRSDLTLEIVDAPGRPPPSSSTNGPAGGTPTPPPRHGPVPRADPYGCATTPWSTARRRPRPAERTQDTAEPAAQEAIYRTLR